MKATTPIVLCDFEGGCDEWFVDQHELCADNWQDFVPAGWVHDPHDESAADLCPEHATPEPHDLDDAAARVVAAMGGPVTEADLIGQLQAAWDQAPDAHPESDVKEVDRD